MASFTVALKSWVSKTFPTKDNNLSDLASASTARTNLGLGTAATTDATAYATAAQGELADATTVQQVTLTGPLAYTLPVSVPAGIVHRVTFTQNGAGGHTVTYDGAPVTVDLTAGASTTVELHPVGAGHATRYPVTNLDAQVSALAADGGSALGASLSSTYATVAQGGKADSAVQPSALATYAAISSLPVGATAQFREMIDAGLSTAMQVIGDSTGDSSIEWVYQLGQRLAADHPAHTVRYRVWDDAAKDYALPITLQAGTAGAARYVRSGAVGGSYMAMPSSALNTITGDIDVRWCGTFDTGYSHAGQILVSKWGAAGNLGWKLMFHSSGALRFDWSTTGSDDQLKVASVVSTPPVDTVIWYRATLAVATGQVMFYTSNDGITWTTIGTNPTPFGATSIFASTYEVQANTSSHHGNVYEIDVRSGIGGSTCVPRSVDGWLLYNNATLHGAPRIDIVNGSLAGAKLSTHTTNLANLTPDFNQSLVIISDSHNEPASIGQTFPLALATFVTAVRGRLPGAGVAVIAQNPETVGGAITAAAKRYHDIRCAQVLAWARQNGCTPINVYRAFMTSGADLDTLLADHVHPTPAGTTIWTDVVETAIAQGS